jgi:drug/metabolite transporter (DMT)-like permease
MALQGLLMFSIGYWLLYLSEMHLTSGLVAVVVSSIIFPNIIHSAIFLGQKIQISVLIGGILGLAGLILIFWPELNGFHFSDSKVIGLIMAAGATFLYSLGNITSARNQEHGLPVIQNSMFSMVYASVIMLLLSLILQKPLTFDPGFSYIASLLYLAVPGTIVGFYCYLTLIGRIGPDRAAYGPMLVPVIALLLSTLFESYRWTPIAGVGLALLVAGNCAALVTRKKA